MERKKRIAITIELTDKERDLLDKLAKLTGWTKRHIIADAIRLKNETLKADAK